MQINGYGLTVDVPDGWYGQIYQRDAGPNETTKPIIQLSTTPLAPPLTDDDVASGTTLKMGTTDAVICVYELEPSPGFSNPALGFEPVESSVVVRPGDLARIENVPPGFSCFLRRIRMTGRYFQVRAVFGSNPAPPRTFAEVNRVLVSFSVQVPVSAVG